VVLDDVPRISALAIVMAGLLGAITWNLVTWWRGIPSSSSHALVGGLAGAVTMAVGADHVAWGFDALASGHLTGVTKVLAALVLSPIIGFWVGFVLHRLMLMILRTTTHDLQRKAQWVTAAGLGFSHGANDAQKSMGILALILMLGGFTEKFEVPTWAMLACAVAMTAGILSGGWRIVRTLGFSIYRIRPLHALDSQLTSGAVILGASIMGAPVSTTHVVASSIMGIGSSENYKAVRWAKAREIAMTWAITIPGSAAAAIGFHFILKALLP
jgi:PiT family inorganic phosphate transporter